MASHPEKDNSVDIPIMHVLPISIPIIQSPSFSLSLFPSIIFIHATSKIKDVYVPYTVCVCRYIYEIQCIFKKSDMLFTNSPWFYFSSFGNLQNTCMHALPCLALQINTTPSLWYHSLIILSKLIKLQINLWINIFYIYTHICIYTCMCVTVTAAGRDI